jgi:hypothetical protein
MNFTIPMISTDLGPLDLATILSLLVIIGLLAVLIGYHFFKYYIFFVKMKYSKMEKKKLCTFRRGLVIFFHIFMILLLSIYTVVLLTEFGFYTLRNKEYQENLVKSSEGRKAFMYLGLHLNSFAILLLYYYIALN